MEQTIPLEIFSRTKISPLEVFRSYRLEWNGAFRLLTRTQSTGVRFCFEGKWSERGTRNCRKRRFLRVFIFFSFSSKTIEWVRGSSICTTFHFQPCRRARPTSLTSRQAYANVLTNQTAAHSPTGKNVPFGMENFKPGNLALGCKLGTFQRAHIKETYSFALAVALGPYDIT